MIAKKEILEKKLEAVNRQISYNILVGIAGILLILFVPLVYFENFMLTFSLESIIGFILFISSVIRGFSLRTKKEDIEVELSVYQKKDKKVKEEFICDYCNQKSKSLEELNKHNGACEKKKQKDEKETRVFVWSMGTFFYIGFGIYLFFNNKINFVALLLIGFILTPFFDKFFNYCKERISNLRHFEINWWKKLIIISIIILICVLINLAVLGS